MDEISIFNYSLSIALIIIFLTLLYSYGTWNFSTWSNLGIRGPKPVPFLGNSWAIHKRGICSALTEWGKKYGDFYGIYLLKTPLLLTTDLEIAKEVFIKDFANFGQRAFVQPLNPYPMNLVLAFTNGQQWKRQRHTMTPTFSASKLKMMGHFINLCCQNLVDAINRKAQVGAPVDVKKIFGAFTMDVIAGTAFSMEINSLKEVEENNAFLETVKHMSEETDRFSIPVLISGLFPFTIPLLKALGLYSSPLKDIQFFTETVKMAIEERRKEKNQKRVDFLQLMLDSEATEEELAANPEAKKMSTDEIVAQCLVVFIAGYETTATTLQYLAYLLALNPEKQEKFYQEVTKAVGKADLTYENVMTIPFVEWCIFETLRLFPPAQMVPRKASQTRTIKGITIPAGSGVGFNVIQAFRDPQNFPEPEKFLPERYDDSTSTISTLLKEMAFGAGPRQCIGMRLALYEAKMAAVALARKFTFHKIPETPEKITFTRNGLATPTQTIYIGAKLR